MEEETIAKAEQREMREPIAANTEDGEMEMPEGMPEDMQGGGPMGGRFSQEMVAGTVEGTNEWLIPMTATGIISGAIVLVGVAICVMMWWLNKKKN